jgi:uncharacterized coiled-coil DUF342 family protein
MTHTMPHTAAMHRMYRIAGALSLALLLATTIVATEPALRSQQKVDALSEAEVEKLRDTNREPNDRVQTFMHFLDDRTDKVRDLTGKPRQPGREEDIHEAMEQFVSIADDLADNLDEYNTRHWDVRHALPKLEKALDRWATMLRSPAEDDRYEVERKLALEAIRDLREDSAKMLEEQKVWFAAHPPAKDSQGRPLNE